MQCLTTKVHACLFAFISTYAMRHQPSSNFCKFRTVLSLRKMPPEKPKASTNQPQPPSPVLSQTPDSGQPLRVPPPTPVTLNKRPAFKQRGPITLNKRHPLPLAKSPALKQRNHTTTKQPAKKNVQWEPEAEQEQEPGLDLPPFVSHSTSAPIWIPGCKPEPWGYSSPPCAYEQYPERHVIIAWTMSGTTVHRVRMARSMRRGRG